MAKRDSDRGVYNIPVVVSGDSRFSSGTYPGVRSSFHVAPTYDNNVHNVPLMQSNHPGSSKYRTLVTTHVSRSDGGGGSGSPVTVVPVQVSFF